MAYEIFYSSGVGPVAVVQRQARWIDFLNRHRSEGRQIYLFDPRWYSDETPDEKEARLVDEYEAAGRPRIIAGSSAGATPTTILGSQYKDAKLFTFAGYHTGEASIKQAYRDLYPAFPAFVAKSEAALEDQGVRERLTCFAPWPRDTVIDTEHVMVADATIKRIPMPHHGLAIGYALVTILPRL